ncbi:Aste57867_7 [Aphanomyces stellatus]|uniref:Aste57867_7 protein n=1 Tax=Aphanomyces stellatus TaxID=120398 RepID=A0A485K5M2_9STRA|nr:hypothetical protein As57867_000007 [Aphanomyces stellatus]VFT77233.1 Aste57867_7 [Aphanomyces stellatus]
MLAEHAILGGFVPAAAAYYASPFLVGPWEFMGSWDDSINFVENSMIQLPLTPASIYTMFTAIKINVYEPLAWLLKAVVFSILGMDAYAVRLVTLGLHVCNCILLYFAAMRLLCLLRPSASSTSLGCLVGTVIYGVHPLHIEVIGWPSAQPYALALLCTLLCFHCHLRTIESTPSRGWATLSLACYVCSVWSKSVVIFTPVGILLIDVLHQSPRILFEWRYYLARSGFAVAAFCLLATMVLANTDGTHLDADVLHLTWPERWLKAAVVWLWPLRMFLWPTQLRFHYEMPTTLDPLEPLVFLSIVAGFGFTICSVQRPATAAAWLFYSVMLVPVSGLVQHGLVFLAADRYAYIPTIVVVPLCGAAFGHLHSPRRVAALGCLWAAALTHVSVLQLHTWRDEETLFRHGLHVDPSDWRALDRLQELLVRSNRATEAMPIIERALVYTPTHGLKAQLQVAKCLMLLQRTKEACAIYETLLADHPTNAHVNNNFGICLWKQGRVSAARLHFQVAVNGTGLTRGDTSAAVNIELVDAWDPRTPIHARVMW